MELNKNSVLIIVFLIFNLFCNTFGEEIKPCYIKYESEDKHNLTTLQCIQQIKPKIASKYPNANTDEKLRDAFFEDLMKDDNPTDDHVSIKVYGDVKCYTQCVSTKMGFISPSNELDKNALFADIKKSNASEAFQKEIISVWSTCADQIGEVSKPEGGFKSNPCKFSLLLRNCAAKIFNQSKDKIAKLSC